MSEKQVLHPKLWTERKPEETIEVYRDWAATYDQDVTDRGYHTPFRIAEALDAFRDQINGPILDFGCGTGISGAALRSAGLEPIHGCDITQEMLDLAEPKGIYEKLWCTEPGAVPAKPGDYGVIVAAGVISLGAAPAESLSQCVDSLSSGALLALSFNDPTIENGGYDAVLDSEVASGRVQVLLREHGPHLDDLEMKSDVIILRRT